MFPFIECVEDDNDRLTGITTSGHSERIDKEVLDMIVIEVFGNAPAIVASKCVDH
jgi:hypothetical protein